MNATTHNHETIDACRLADAAAAESTEAARLWGLLEGQERTAAARWADARKAFRTLGDDAAADAAQAMSRWHWKKADRLAAAFHNHHASRPNA